MSSPSSIRNHHAMTNQQSQPSTSYSRALITGASSGIGLALCRLLASKKISLLITGRDIGKLNALAQELSSTVDVIAFPADLDSDQGRAIIIDKIYQYLPDLIINNAGFGLYGEALTYETKEQLKIANVDAIAVLELTLEGARAMVSAGQKGVILNVSSAAAFQVFPCLAVYAASKAFVNSISESFDFEMRKHGIRILASCPGMVSTAFSSRAAGVHIAKENVQTMTADFAAKQIWRQIEKQKILHIFDWKTRFATWLSRFIVPKSWVAAIITKIIEARHPHRKIITQNKPPTT